MTGTIYPTGIDGYSQLPLVVDKVSPVVADDVNRLRNTIVAIEKELGINPSGTFGTVKDRLDAGEGGTASPLTTKGDLYTFDGYSNTREPVGTDGLFLVADSSQPNGLKWSSGDGYQSDFIAAQLEEPTDKEYFFTTEVPFSGTIESVTTKTSSGTCTVTVNVNSIAIGGTANSASTVEQTQNHSTGNTFASGDSISFTVSANAGSADLIVTVKISRSGTIGFLGEVNNVQNVGTGGVGVFKQKVGEIFQLRNINSGSSKISVSLDSVNNEIDIDANPDSFQFTNLQVGSNYSVVSATVSTTNNSLTTLYSKLTFGGVIYGVEANIVARRTGGSSGSANDSSVYVLRGRYKNNGGTLTVSNVTTEYTSEDQLAWNATLTLSGTNIIVQVQGATNNNINWHGIISIQQA